MLGIMWGSLWDHCGIMLGSSWDCFGARVRATPRRSITRALSYPRIQSVPSRKGARARARLARIFGRPGDAGRRRRLRAAPAAGGWRRPPAPGWRWPPAPGTDASAGAPRWRPALRDCGQFRKNAHAIPPQKTLQKTLLKTVIPRSPGLKKAKSIAFLRILKKNQKNLIAYSETILIAYSETIMKNNSENYDRVF